MKLFTHGTGEKPCSNHIFQDILIGHPPNLDFIDSRVLPINTFLRTKITPEVYVYT